MRFAEPLRRKMPSTSVASLCLAGGERTKEGQRGRQGREGEGRGRERGEGGGAPFSLRKTPHFAMTMGT